MEIVKIGLLLDCVGSFILDENVVFPAMLISSLACVTLFVTGRAIC